MNDHIIKPEDVNFDKIKAIMQNSAIEFEDYFGIYVTDYKYHFWINVDEDLKVLRFSSHISIFSQVSEIEILRFVNHANSNNIMLQFSYEPERDWFFGSYCYPYPAGLIPTHLLKLAMRFPAIFEDVVDEGIKKGLLTNPMPSPQEGESAPKPPGRPPLGATEYLAEFRRRAKAKKPEDGLKPTLKQESIYLQDWLEAHHSDKPRPTLKTIENKIRHEFREARERHRRPRN